MKVYMLQWMDKDDGNCHSWHRSKRSAEKEAKVVAKIPGVDNVDILPRTIKTTKQGLVNWLNSNYVRDNG